MHITYAQSRILNLFLIFSHPFFRQFLKTHPIDHLGHIVSEHHSVFTPWAPHPKGRDIIFIPLLATPLPSQQALWYTILNRVGPDLFFFSRRIIRHALPNIAFYPAIYC